MTLPLTVSGVPAGTLSLATNSVGMFSTFSTAVCVSLP
jgi:hypothetical protein